MESHVFAGIEALDRAAWDAVVQGHPYASAEWWHFNEQVLNVLGHYVLVYKDDQPVAAAAFNVMRREHLPVENKLMRGLIEQLLSRRPLLVCRTAPMTRYQGLFLPSNPDDAQESLTAILEAAYALARKHQVSFILFDYVGAGALELDWGEMKVLKDTFDQGTRLNLQWPTFEAYLQTLSGSARRYVRRHIKEARDLGIEVTVGEAAVPTDEMLPLIENVDRAYKQSAYPFARDLLDKARGRPEASWVTARLNGKLVMCGLLLYDPESGICSPVLYGRDYEVQYAYFYAYYEVLRYALEVLHARVLIGETGAPDFKQRLDFTPDARNNQVLASPSPLLMTLLRHLL